MPTQDLPLSPHPSSGGGSPAAGHAATRPSDLRLPGLDALRAVAALMVVIMHTGAIWPNATRIAPASYLAVDFFFLLSGFVMGRTYERKMIAGSLGPARFIAARYRRLWPTMAVGAALSVPFLWRDGEGLAPFLLAAVPNALLLPSFAAAALFPLNTPAWSIFFELAANYAHAAFLYRLRQRELLAITMVFLVPLATCAIAYGTLDLGARPGNMGWGFARVGFSYALGLLLWRWHGDRPPLRVHPALALGAMPVLFLAAGATGAAGFGGAMLSLGFVVLAGPLLAWGGLALRSPSPAMRTACLAAGAMSFPLYAVHYPVLLGAEALGLPELAGPPVAVALAALLTWALGGFDHIRRAPYTF
ncbi:acyltransferase [Novosphingobium flavum]|uniref:Acyltransferase n=1 Tax=Novosphingobium flavum TaxID=1778672 RepID=A0A7X1KKQ4_9SPHN|nr:acyltransferase [Novosphingobium flavum]